LACANSGDLGIEPPLFGLGEIFTSQPVAAACSAREEWCYLLVSIAGRSPAHAMANEIRPAIPLLD
jgi:hypothetical protein